MRRRSVFQLIAAVLLAGPAGAVEEQAAALVSSYVWHDTADWFGGFSALHVSDGGQSIVAISDRAKVVTARIERDATQITGVEVLGHWPLLSSKGRRMSGYTGDSEGIAIAPDGGFFISFEGIHRVAYYPAPGTPAQVLPRPRDFQSLERNGSFEALAIDRQGRLYTMTEENRTLRGDIPVYRWDGSRWSLPFVLPPRGGFLPVAADFGPDDRLYVLERDVSVLGFRSRLRRWDMDEDVPRDEQVLFETGSSTHDNLEGLSVWRDDQNRLRATMISDDNFLSLQQTELVEYVLPD